MSGLGYEEKFWTRVIYVRSWGQSGHRKRKIRFDEINVRFAALDRPIFSTAFTSQFDPKETFDATRPTPKSNAARTPN